MKNSLTKALTALAVVSFVSISPVWSQEPISLEVVPQNLDPDTTGTTSQSPDDTSWGGAVQSNTVIGSGSDSIQVNVLKAITSDTAGLIGQDDGGYPFDMWQGTLLHSAESLLSQLPVHTRSPVMRQIMERLLTSQAAVPVGQGIEGNFVTRRLEILSAMGVPETVSKMLDNTPGRDRDQRLLRISSDTNLLKGDFVQACSLIAGLQGEVSGEYWEKLMIFCQLLAGKNMEAELGLALLRETGSQDEMLFLLLDAMMNGEVPLIDTLQNPTPIQVAAIRASKARLSSEASANPAPAVLAAIASNTDLDIKDRLSAAEQAVASSALPVEVLRNLYQEIPFSEEDFVNPISVAESVAGPFARALLYQVGIKQVVDGAKAEAVSLALKWAAIDGLYASTANAFLPIIKGVPPRSDLIWFGGDAVRALVFTGEESHIDAWLSLLRMNASMSPDAADTLALLEPTVQLAGLGGTEKMGQAGLNAWFDVVSQTPDGYQKATQLFTLLESLGTPISAALWERLARQSTAQEVSLADPITWQRLSAAGRAGRLGETTVLALIALGNGGPAKASPLLMGHVASTLTLAGLGDEARRLCVESILAAGL